MKKLLIALSLLFSINVFAFSDSIENRLMLSMNIINEKDISSPADLFEIKIIYMNVVKQLKKAEGIKNSELIRSVENFNEAIVQSNGNLFTRKESREIARDVAQISDRNR